MRLLLDENLPKRLKLDYSEHEIFTVREMQWNGIKNGELLKLMVANSFDALLTFNFGGGDGMLKTRDVIATNGKVSQELLEKIQMFFPIEE